jgi:glycine betaine/proline transport system substrate-binding protein
MNIRFSLRHLYLISVLGMMLLALTACPAATPEAAAPAEDEAPTEAAAEEAPTEAAAEEAAAEEAAAEEAALPGEGQTLNVGLPTWDTGWFQNWVVFLLAEELGYEISEPNVLENPAFYTSVATGDLDFWSSGWLPLHNTFVEPVADQVAVAGTLVQAGALQGYLIDQATADEYGITNLEDFKDPEIAALFDTDDNGLANLTGCNPGWGCELVIEHHLDVYELRDAIEHDQGTYSALMADTIARYEAGEPIFFYTWTPNWTIVELVPGEDVVWIEVPFPDLPEDQAQFEDATQVAGVDGCVSDPCEMGFPGNDLAIIANQEWLDENPALAELFDSVEIPLLDIASQNARLLEGEDSEEEIIGHAEEWIAENQERVDEWLQEARSAAE